MSGPTGGDLLSPQASGPRSRPCRGTGAATEYAQRSSRAGRGHDIAWAKSGRAVARASPSTRSKRLSFRALHTELHLCVKKNLRAQEMADVPCGCGVCSCGTQEAAAAILL